MKPSILFRLAAKTLTPLCFLLALAIPTLARAGAGGLVFDGVNDHVTFGPASGLGASTFTIETWFMRTGTGLTAGTGSGGLTAVPLLAKGRSENDGSNVDMNWFLGLSGNTLAADFEEYGGGQNYPVIGATSVSMNVWHHAAASYDGSTWRLYLDGVLDKTLALPAAKTPRFDSIQHAALGTTLNSAGTPVGYFAGVLKQARVWNYARSQSEIAAGMAGVYAAGTSGLLGQWALAETVGTVASDSSGKGVTGTLVNGPVWVDGMTTVQIIKGPWLQNVTPSSVVVMWETQVAATSRVEYGSSASLGLYVEDAVPRTIHEMSLPSLSPNSQYFYRVKSGDGQSAINSFVTAPDDDTTPFRFVAYGDTRTETAVHRAVAQSIVRSAPDFVLHVGDQVNSGRIYAEWEPQFFTPAADMLKGTPLFPVMGNHEFTGGERIWYYDFFSVPDNGVTGYGEHYYAFTYGCVRFIGLSACEGGCDSFVAGSTQFTWLVNQLIAPEFVNAKWRVVYMHNPPYTSIARDNAVNTALRTYLVPLFEQYGVDVVFSGDDHFYRHSLRNGIHYIVTGGGGAPLHDVGTQIEGATLVYGEKANQHCVIDVSPAVFQFRSLRTNDTVMDSFSLTKDTTAPLITGVAATDSTANSARIVWNTDELADSVVDYGTTLSYGFTASDSTMATAHSIPLANLQPQTTYHYRVKSMDYAANSSSIAGNTFATLNGNHAPVAQPQSVTTAEDAPTTITLTATDAENNTLTFTVVTGPVHGTLTGTTSNPIYTPAANYTGPDSFTFKANDGQVDSAPATVSVTVTPVNDPPTAQPHSVTTIQNTPKSITLAGSDVDGDSLSFSVVAGPTHGTLAGSAPNLTYTPAADYNGGDAFTFKANDGQVDSSTATVSITVTAALPNAPSNLVATPVSKSQINLTWSDNSSNETGFEVARSLDNVTFVSLVTVNAGVSAYSNTGLAANKQYYYRVRAVNSSGSSAYSNTAKARTLRK